MRQLVRGGNDVGNVVVAVAVVQFAISSFEVCEKL